MQHKTLSTIFDFIAFCVGWHGCYLANGFSGHRNMCFNTCAAELSHCGAEDLLTCSTTLSAILREIEDRVFH